MADLYNFGGGDIDAMVSRATTPKPSIRILGFGLNVYRNNGPTTVACLGWPGA